MTKVLAAFAFSIALTSISTNSQQLDLVIEPVFADLNTPWAIEFLPNGHYLITERSGGVVVLDTEGQPVKRLMPAFEELWVDGQAGLFDVRLAPDFTESRHLFFSYACGSAQANTTCLARAEFRECSESSTRGSAAPTEACPALMNIQRIFEAQPRRRGSAHYGARMAFLPDQTLILTLGDGFDFREQAQHTSNHIGAIVRLTQTGEAPNDNPLLARNNSLPEIYSYGHRNPQGVTWHEPFQALLSSEHGPRGGDELNHIRAGGNYGWPLLTGGVDYTGARISPHQSLPGMVPPLYE